MKRAKGQEYFYWARTTPWTRLPSPYDEPDQFLRKIAHLKRVNALIEESDRTGTFGALVAKYRATRHFREKLSDRTRKVYDAYLSRMLVAYADAPLREITPEDIQERVLDANEDTPGAANMMLALFRTLHAFAIKRPSGRGIPDWTEGLEAFPKDEANEHQPWPDDVLEAALQSDDALFRQAVTLALYTGQRPGDVCAMTWGAVSGDMIRVRQQKTKTALEIPMHEDLAAMIAQLPRSDRHLFLLCNRRGGPLKEATFREWCASFTEARGQRCVPHGLRKNAVNELFEQGCDAAQVAAITGHKSLQMLEHYGKRRSQPKIARLSMAKWSARQNKNGKTNG